MFNKRKLRHRYSEEEIEFLKTIEVDPPKKGVGIFRFTIILLLTAGLLGALGYIYIDYSDYYFKKYLYPEGLTADAINNAPPEPTIMSKRPSETMQ